MRMKILAKLPDEIKTPLMKLNSSLCGKVSVSDNFLRKSTYILLCCNTHFVFMRQSVTTSVFQSIEEFLCNVEAAAEQCGIMLKKGDKKKEK